MGLELGLGSGVRVKGQGALVRFVEHADHLADVGLLVTLGHEALLVEHGVDLSTREVVG